MKKKFTIWDKIFYFDFKNRYFKLKINFLKIFFYNLKLFSLVL